MFTIGDFARLGRVSVRMLRHYDAIGLLPPAAVDPFSGYRSYTAGQLYRLNRILVLKELGFTLDQVGSILDEDLGPAELSGMLRLRRARIEAQRRADELRLAGIEARLRMIEKEGLMPTADIVLKQIPPVRLAELTAVAGGYGPEHIGPAITPLYARLGELIGAASVTPTGPATAYYDASPDADDDAVTVHAGMPVPVGPSPAYGFAVVDLPGIEAATIVHRGPMDDVMPSLQAIAEWIETHGYRPVGKHREVYLDYCADDPAEGVTELQVPVVPA